jgi:hypothetical protein
MHCVSYCIYFDTNESSRNFGYYLEQNIVNKANAILRCGLWREVMQGGARKRNCGAEGEGHDGK